MSGISRTVLLIGLLTRAGPGVGLAHTAADPVETGTAYVTAFGQRPSVMTVDSRGRVYIAGTLQRPSGDPFDLELFVARIDARGTRFEYVRVFEGSRGSFPTAIAVDRAGRLLVVGHTTASRFPATKGSGVTRGDRDGFVVRLDSAGGTDYSALIGGDGADLLQGVAWLPNGGYVVAGESYLGPLPFVPAVAAQPAPGGATDAVVVWFGSDDEVQGATYLGGRDAESVRALAVDRAGNAFVAGETSSLDFPTTPGGFHQGPDLGSCPPQDYLPGDFLPRCRAGYVAKLGVGGRSLDYTVTFGAPGRHARTSAAILKEDGTVVVQGWTSSSLAPTDLLPPGQDAPFTADLAPDGGSFTRVNRPDPQGQLQLVAVGRDGAELSVGAGGVNRPVVRPVQRSNAGGPVWRTDDDGRSWTQIETDAELLGARSLVVDSARPNRLVAGTLRGLFISDDSGATWRNALSDGVTSVATGGVNEHAILAATYRSIARSIDAGRTWTFADVLVSPVVGASLILDPFDPATVFAVAGRTLALTRDGGRTWRTQSLPWWAYSLAPSLVRRGVLFAGTDQGVWESTDRGSTWTPTSLGRGVISPVAVDPSRPRTLYAAGYDAPDQRFYVSEDEGASWQAWPAPPRFGGSLVVSHYGTIYASALGPARSSEPPSSLSISRDQGRSWTSAPVYQTWFGAAVTGGGNPGHLTILTGVGLDGYVARTRGLDASLEFASYLGGPGDDILDAGAVDPAGNIYVAGSSNVPSFTSRRLTDLPDSGSSYSGFVAKITTAPDRDGDGMSDNWEARYGLDVGTDDAAADDDGDGVPNVEEFNAQTHPRGTFVRYFAEGAASTFFDARFTVFNPGNEVAHVTVRCFAADSRVANTELLLEPGRRDEVSANVLFDGQSAEFMTVVESDHEVAVDRTMRWDGGNGSHIGEALRAPSTTWYFAEGVTHSGFQTFFLLANPSTQRAQVQVTYLRAEGLEPVIRVYDLAPLSRRTIWVNQEGGDLAQAEFGAGVQSLNGIAILAERAVYRSGVTGVFQVGHVAAGQPSLDSYWIVPHVLTGEFFESYLLLANPNDRDALVRVRYILPNGTEVARMHYVRARSRSTVPIEAESIGAGQPAIVIEPDWSHPVQPIVAERVTYWPGSVHEWQEGSSAPAIRRSGGWWAATAVEIGGRRHANPYLNIFNPEPVAAVVTVSLSLDTGQFWSRTLVIEPLTRVSLALGVEFPEVTDRAAAVTVAVAERSVQGVAVDVTQYDDGAGLAWSGGGQVAAQRLDADAPRLIRSTAHVGRQYLIVLTPALPDDAEHEIVRALERQYRVSLWSLLAPGLYGLDDAADDAAVRLSRNPNVAGVWENVAGIPPMPDGPAINSSPIR